MRTLHRFLPAVLLLALPAFAAPAQASQHHWTPASTTQAVDQAQGDPADPAATPDPADDPSDDPDATYFEQSPGDDPSDPSDTGDDPSDPTDDGDTPDPDDTTPPASTPFPPAPPEAPAVMRPMLVTTGTVSGRVALMRTNGKAAIPRGAPLRVRAIIAAANRIIGKPYKWGGGHAKLADTGYDCSGTVSYSLIRSGELGAALDSGGFKHWGLKGDGTSLTIYASKGHVYMEVAGLRLDTSAVSDPGGRDGVRWRPVIGKRRGFVARHIAGL